MLKKIDNKGFSIIEVLIVLAIAGLIMLVVFLAVPALRRNAANNGRQSDASRISSAVQDCLTNKNGLAYSCDQLLVGGTGNVDAGTLSQLDATTTSIKFRNYKNAAGTVVNPVASWPYTPAVSADAITATVVYSSKCSADGSTAASSANSRDFTVLYWKKTSGTTNTSVCIGS